MQQPRLILQGREKVTQFFVVETLSHSNRLPTSIVSPISINNGIDVPRVGTNYELELAPFATLGESEVLR